MTTPAANQPIQPRPGFDWWHVAWGGPYDPVSEECSYCGQPFGEDEVPLRPWNSCTKCMETWWGLGTREEAP